jgi:Na+-transporting NADH:ubiquinone oxidoreductase subunit C
MANKKFKCTTCGYIHEGDKAPETCPQCNAPASAFVELKAEKKLPTSSNAYTFAYAAAMVVVVAFLLSFVSSSLRAKQDANVKLDTKKQILYSLNIRDLDGAEAEAKYAQVVKDEKDINGQKVYACQVGDQEVVVVALKGMGLWGGISGYLAVDKDDKVYGAYFNHESETAGLGAEIKDSQAWQEKFIGKKIFDENGNVILSVVKKVEAPESQVDCVTGATLTSNGVDAMIKDCLKKVKEEK